MAQYSSMSAMGGQQFQVAAREVTVEDVFRDVVGMTPRDVMGEFSFTIEAGTTQRQDPVAKREMAETLMSQVMPKALELGDYTWANAVMDMVFDAWGTPRSERPPPLQPPMPPALPMAEPGVPPQGEAMEVA